MLALLQKPYDGQFGNYLLHGIEEIYLHSPVGYWPQTVAWKVLAALVVLFLLRWAYRAWLKWQRNKYRRLAIKEIRDLQNHSQLEPLIEALPRILKATALHSFPRSTVAKLTGRAWLQALDEQCKSTNFDSPVGDILLRLSYRSKESWQPHREQIDALTEMVIDWIEKHRAPENLADSESMS